MHWVNVLHAPGERPRLIDTTGKMRNIPERIFCILPVGYFLHSAFRILPLPMYFFLIHHCTFSFITAHFVHHCTLKQALISGVAIERAGGGKCPRAPWVGGAKMRNKIIY